LAARGQHFSASVPHAVLADRRREAYIAVLGGGPTNDRSMQEAALTPPTIKPTPRPMPAPIHTTIS